MKYDDPNTMLLARILAEIYRIQNALDGMATGGSPAQIYGLLNGFDAAIDDEIEVSEGISNEQLEAAAEVLDPIFSDPAKLRKFTGFYDVENELAKRGVSRVDAIKILTYWKAAHRFEELIAKMNSANSPVECKRFELDDFEK